MTDTFWALLLAHLIGDYPLQPNWMVGIKRTWAGLALHVMTHLAVLLVLARPSLMAIWPYLLGLSFIHFAIDVLKNQIWQRWPHWVVGPYLFDQGLHIASILLVGAWIEGVDPGAVYLIPGPWLVLGCALVFVTFAWFITERVVFYGTPAYTQEVIRQRWSRMAIRAILVLAIVWIGQPQGSGPLAMVAVAPWLPYLPGPYRRRALLTDLVVALAAALVVLIAT